MLLALFLHLYQPPTQFAKVLKDVTDASYRRLLNSIRRHPSAKVTINVPASLTEQLAAHADSRGCLADLAELVKRGQVELVSSAAYHPLLTEIPASETRRQILLNDEINRRFFGDVYQPRGFFPPEMAVDEKVLEVVGELGFKWIIVDESALGASERPRLPSGTPGLLYFKGRTPYGSRRPPLRLFIRNSDLSVKVAFSQIRTVKELAAGLTSGQADSCILAMDGETFGHHRPEQLKFLEELFSRRRIKDAQLQLVTLSELQSRYLNPPEITIKKSSWGPWERWKDPQNPIHRLQWELYHLAINTVKNSKFSSENSENSVGQRVGESENQKVGNSDLSDTPKCRSSGTPSYSEFSESQWVRARELLDKALHSDQFWWASGEPFYHYQMVERGARMLRDVVSTERAQELYDKITRK